MLGPVLPASHPECPDAGTATGHGDVTGPSVLYLVYRSILADWHYMRFEMSIKTGHLLSASGSLSAWISGVAGAPG